MTIGSVSMCVYILNSSRSLDKQYCVVTALVLAGLKVLTTVD